MTINMGNGWRHLHFLALSEDSSLGQCDLCPISWQLQYDPGGRTITNHVHVRLIMSVRCDFWTNLALKLGHNRHNRIFINRSQAKRECILFNFFNGLIVGYLYIIIKLSIAFLRDIAQNPERDYTHTGRIICKWNTPIEKRYWQ